MTEDLRHMRMMREAMEREAAKGPARPDLTAVVINHEERRVEYENHFGTMESYPMTAPEPVHIEAHPPGCLCQPCWAAVLESDEPLDLSPLPGGGDETRICPPPIDLGEVRYQRWLSTGIDHMRGLLTYLDSVVQEEQP